MTKYLKAYKGFWYDLSCRGFKFERGETFYEDHAKLCECGFHACTKPTDCFAYYMPFKMDSLRCEWYMSGNRYFEVILIDPTDERYGELGDSIRCAPAIKIGRELSTQEMVVEDYKISVDKIIWARDFLKKNCDRVVGLIFPDYAERAKDFNVFFRNPHNCNHKILIDIIENIIQEERLRCIKQNLTNTVNNCKI